MSLPAPPSSTVRARGAVVVVQAVAPDDVVAAAAEDRVGAVPAEEVVVAVGARAACRRCRGASQVTPLRRVGDRLGLDDGLAAGDLAPCAAPGRWRCRPASAYGLTTIGVVAVAAVDARDRRAVVDVDDVVAGAGVDRVGARVGVDDVVAAPRVDRVGARAAVDRGRRRRRRGSCRSPAPPSSASLPGPPSSASAPKPPKTTVVAGAAGEAVVAGAAVEEVVAGAATEAVGAGLAEEAVGAAGAGQAVRAAAAVEDVGGAAVPERRLGPGLPSTVRARLADAGAVASRTAASAATRVGRMRAGNGGAEGWRCVGPCTGVGAGNR